MQKIRTGDQVMVMVGKNKGKCGVVLRSKSEYILIKDLNCSRKHVKPNPAKNIPGGMQDKAMPLRKANIALVDIHARPSRVGISIKHSRKIRFLKKTGMMVSV